MKCGGIYTLQQVEGDSNKWFFCCKTIRTDIIPVVTINTMYVQFKCRST